MKPVLQGPEFASALVQWQKAEGRQHLPWQHTHDAYRVWLSEVMLQQTQVVTVLAYYARFLEAFPTVHALAAAPEAEVMRLWAGLGYYSRARNLHACAKQVVQRFNGEFPRSPLDLETLPGIGLSTAGAIASLAYGVSAPIMDGNVKRVFCRYYGIEGYAEQTAVKKQLWSTAQQNVPQLQAGVYNQALMDLGATRCTPKNPACGTCPLMSSCVALRKGMVAQLPTPKPKKPRPSLYFVALLLRDARGALALGCRQEKGIWRDLWVPPLAAVASDALLDSTEQFAQLESAWALPEGLLSKPGKNVLQAQCLGLQGQDWLVHELTHRKMHFKVLSLQLPNVVADFRHLADVAVPKLVHKLLDRELVLSAQAAVAQQDALDF